MDTTGKLEDRGKEFTKAKTEAKGLVDKAVDAVNQRRKNQREKSSQRAIQSPSYTPEKGF